MVFYEKIGIIKIFFHLLTNKPAFYWRRGLILYLFCTALPAFFVKTKKVCKKLDYGYVEAATNVKKNSHSEARAFIDKMQHERFFKEGAGLFGIDFISIFKIFIFSEVVYPKHEFFQLTMRYASEHSNEVHAFYVKSQSSKTYYDRLIDFGIVHVGWSCDRIIFIFSIILSPVLLWVYWKTKGQERPLHFNNNIICNSPKISMYDIYNELFGKYPQTKYVISGPYPTRASSKGWESLGIINVSLDEAGYDYLKKYVFRYVYLCLKCYKEIASYGTEMLRLFYDIIVGRSEAPHGQGNVFITFEHFYTRVAVRNEFIRLEGSKSIFFAQTNYICPKYYFTETGYNYDFVCSSDKCFEDFYSLSMATTKVFLPTGGYAIHKKTRMINDYTNRTSKLKAFKGVATTITILSCGLVDMSFNIEQKLMNLAKQLAQQANVKVFIRLKAWDKMPYYDKFYSPFAENEPSILLTSQEYELWDFLPVTDLFITDISSSGCEMAMCGGQTIYVDFLKTPDFYLFWEKIAGVFVPEEKAFDEIMRWVNDGPGGPVRTERKEIMMRLTEYLAYTFPDFEAYRKNLINQLSNHVPFFPKYENPFKI